MKQVCLDCVSDEIKKFIRTLPVGKEGCILEMNGRPLFRVVPIYDAPLDKAKLKQAILNRRDESRRLNAEWEAVDREMWDRITDEEA